MLFCGSLYYWLNGKSSFCKNIDTHNTIAKSVKKYKKNHKLIQIILQNGRGGLQKWSAAYCDFDHENLGFAVIFFFRHDFFAHT